MLPAISQLRKQILEFKEGDPGLILSQIDQILTHQADYPEGDINKLIQTIRRKIFEKNIFQYRDLKNGLNQLLCWYDDRHS